MIKFVAEQPVAVNLAGVQDILGQIRNNKMGGWYDWPENYDKDEFAKIKTTAEKIRSDSQYLVCIGIGGSYLGHKAIIDALDGDGKVKILYAGNSLSAREFDKVLQELGDADFSINVISKSGTTTEPALAFRFLKGKLRQKYGEQYRERIYAITDAKSGALHDEAMQEKYTSFVIPDGIGGRYSVLTAVGLLPIAVAGIDIDELMAGAAEEYKTLQNHHPSDLDAVKYACARAELFGKNYDTEVLASFEPSTATFGEWWKQLFGESEGKNQQGIYPAASVYTTDLHSLGQFMQEGRRNLLETMLAFEQAPAIDFTVEEDQQNLDGLNYLTGKSMNFINLQAMAATIAAHRAGEIPVYEIIAPDYSAKSFGALIYFFELACAISAKLCGVNPFDQPGVEAYKNNMFALLGKPGF